MQAAALRGLPVIIRRRFSGAFTTLVEKNAQACSRLVDRVLGGAYMGFTGGGAVVLLCGLAFPDKRIVSAFCAGAFSRLREGSFGRAALLSHAGFAWAGAGSLTIWF